MKRKAKFYSIVSMLLSFVLNPLRPLTAQPATAPEALHPIRVAVGGFADSAGLRLVQSQRWAAANAPDRML